MLVFVSPYTKVSITTVLHMRPGRLGGGEHNLTYKEGTTVACAELLPVEQLPNPAIVEHRVHALRQSP
jgi:hypothetical protein